MEEDGRLVQYIFRGDEVVAEKTEGNIIRLIRSTDLLASDAEYARTYYHYASDELGSITHVADDRKVRNHYEYDVWGNLAVCEETVPNRFLFTGQQYDPITQQYYLRARYYNPVMARFTQEDTYRGDGLNLYAYCRNNPVSYVDPSGHCSKDPDGGKQLPAVIPEGKQLPAIYVPQQEALLRWYANFQNDTETGHTGNRNNGEFMSPAVIPKQPLPSLDSLQSPLMPEPPRQLPAVIYPLPQNLLDGNPQNRVSGPTADVPDNSNRTSGSDSNKVLGGSFKDVNASRGADEVGHHLPQNAYIESELGMLRSEGPALLMTKEDHALTRTYKGRGRQTMVTDVGLNARQRMVLDIIHIRENCGTKYNVGLLKAIEYAKTLPKFQK